MCIVFWTLEHHDYALIICSNRDEFLDRPTADANFHSFGHEASNGQGFVLSGIDKLAGGTWFGLNRAGKVALLTNITEPVKSVATSRGTLVSSYLLSNSLDLDDLGTFIPRHAKFAGFNLLLFAPEPAQNGLCYEASFVSNGGAGGNLASRPLSPEERTCGAFSNGIDGKGGSEWPKVKHGLKDFASILRDLPRGVDERQLVERLFGLLSWSSPETITERSELRKTIAVAPFPTEMNESSAAAGQYGTRLSTVLLIGRNGEVLFIERDIWKIKDGKITRGDPSSDRVFRFNLNGPDMRTSQYD